ncbi:DUF6145 family protein [Anaerotalea alkaliphila]|uniref:Uncharacterized protein n=1 Tax=Anaerotalea alkaliphila TaxID=2662126 RepID=A0A7X5HV40_9FIRM|nr:DUF6145 family protein [Anaerotalea alkaliphila]NDL67210.1 hypothetical protein [Anaerotalea alkaliphila]
MEEKQTAEPVVLAVANSYEQLYYFNEDFDGIPRQVQEELKVICVLQTEEMGGIFSVGFSPEGTLYLETLAQEDDITYDEIGAHLKVKELQRRYRELWESLEAYFKAFY